MCELLFSMHGVGNLHNIVSASPLSKPLQLLVQFWQVDKVQLIGQDAYKVVGSLVTFLMADLQSHVSGLKRPLSCCTAIANGLD